MGNWDIAVNTFDVMGTSILGVMTFKDNKNSGF